MTFNMTLEFNEQSEAGNRISLQLCAGARGQNLQPQRATYDISHTRSWVGSCESTGSTKHGKFLEQLSNYQLFLRERERERRRRRRGEREREEGERERERLRSFKIVNGNVSMHTEGCIQTWCIN